MCSVETSKVTMALLLLLNVLVAYMHGNLNRAWILYHNAFVDV